MSLSEADLNIYFPSVGASVTFALAILVCIYFVSTKILAGANYVLNDYKRKKELETIYKGMFSTRDNLLYHITRAQSRGEVEEAARLMADLERLDKRIDSLEESNRDCFRKGYFMDGNEKEKMKV